ncbi:Uncharacterized membrane protein YesL [Propionibacterium cyclohexanicum]|uniref:Uncharacterized membrane protein YesL n=1 Tax=Propionibacterium cyclohexanicum TaxID=64702 RepID=A0A1H9SBB7_9ACTN|nr:DUF624 domain-containing protein [Propionibacterium cyclohexanicum]SER81663.1 Uncharacterized membrane protein YesL [Propionibacterium cyclohexanicum]
MNPKTAQKIYEITLMASRLVMMNLLWIVFVLLGGVVFGIVPATVVVVSIFRDDRVKDDEFSWVRLAWQRYFPAVRRFAGVSVIFSVLLIGAILAHQLPGVHDLIPAWLALLVVVLLTCLFLPYLAVNDAHFTIDRISLVKNSLLLPILWPLTSIRLVLTEAAMILLCWLVPGLLPFVAVSVPLYLATWLLTARWDRQLARSQPDRSLSRPVGAS